MESLKLILSILQNHNNAIAVRQVVGAKQITAMSFELIVNKYYYRKTLEFCSKPLKQGYFLKQKQSTV